MFMLVTDNTADLPLEYLQEHNVGLMSLSYILDGVVYGKDKELDCKEFYGLMRSGKMPTTSQINPDEAKEFFEKSILENKEILYIAFSSGLSGTYNSGRIAAEEIMEEHPDVRIVVVDSLCASMGEGLLVHKAIRLRDEGKSLDEAAEWLEQHKKNVVHAFTVDDLFHLHRGGRVSKTAALLGTLAAIKPKMHVDDEGHLTLIGKVRGRKKSLISLVDYMEEKMGSWAQENKDDYIFISHSDCLEDAQFVAELVKERFQPKSVTIAPIGPVIGAHTGRNTVGLFFQGQHR